jgi:hypothetical protein
VGGLFPRNSEPFSFHFICFLFCSELLERNVSNLQTVLRMTFEAAMNDIVMGKPNPWTATVMSAAFKSKPVESSSVRGFFLPYLSKVSRENFNFFNIFPILFLFVPFSFLF